MTTMGKIHIGTKDRQVTFPPSGRFWHFIVNMRKQ